jgi:hypothetical protein
MAPTALDSGKDTKDPPENENDANFGSVLEAFEAVRGLLPSMHHSRKL